MRHRAGIFGQVSAHQKSLLRGSGLGGGKASSLAPVTIVNTIFNEGIPGATLTGTSPAVNVHGNLWVTWPTTGPLTFATPPPPGAGSPGSGNGEVLDTGAPSYTVTFSSVTNTATQFIVFSGHDTSMNDRLQVSLLGAGGISLVETVSGASTTIQTQPVAGGASGSIVAVVHGTSITVTAFGQAPMVYTIPGGHPDINGPAIGLLSSTPGYIFHGVNVTVP